MTALRLRVWGCLLAVGLCAPIPARAAIHAIVYGFNDYSFIKRPLTGAVNDAEDVTEALRKRGIADVVKRTEAATRRADFMADWNAMLGRARKGDLLIFAFAGHGIRLIDGDAKRRIRYGDDKGFLLPQYDDLPHPGEPLKRSEELLRDEDLYDLFKKTAEGKGVRILFIADACHAGTGMREPSPTPLRFYQPPSTATRPSPSREAATPRPPIAGVVAIGAQTPDKTVAEVKIDDRPRGALSYAFAQAISGTDADPERRGVLTPDDLFTYVRDVVRQRSDHKQEPVLFAREEDTSTPLFGEGKAAGPALPPLPGLPEVAVYAGGASVAGVATADDSAGADLIYDPQHRRVSDLAGDTLVDGVNAAHLAGAVAARRLLLFLRRAGEIRGPLTVSMRQRGTPRGSIDNGFQTPGTQLQFESADSPLPFVTVFDLNSDGTVQFLAPRNGDTPKMAANQTFEVKPPFGADFVVFVRSKEPLVELDAFFAKRGDTAPAAGLFDVLSRDLRANDVRIGIQGLFTCERLTGDRQCATPSAP